MISWLWRSRSTVQPAGRNGNSRLDLVDDRPAPRVQDRPQPILEAELPALLADQVDHGQTALASRTPQPAAELLREQRRRRGRTQQQDAIDIRHVDALAEHLD